LTELKHRIPFVTPKGMTQEEAELELKMQEAKLHYTLGGLKWLLSRLAMLAVAIFGVWALVIIAELVINGHA